MTISEMNQCIDKLKEYYPFDDDNTNIILFGAHGDAVVINTINDTGIRIEMTISVDDLWKNGFSKNSENKKGDI